ncbi:putative tRNA-splicing endonuclease subunit sen34 [Neolecta irregularis DAH-3]|uniref:tRNA-intron lyase n=1 Tax=Neolecta irregularis (strain DAH-3) TaxID=1198029 RepID=A0A1U7LMM3_NEOID|nr:putative tRNA-splicing endonuclease subunit sen34 [Neolecta irregularis DAH-3]|eukprot:OLL23792.1 putative tRNA-splicing endonuclease subunit sen34 [Neolecta irregularis DAH-3]
MCGVLVGTLPQLPQQNVFLGVPLQLMTEEAALLVECGAAYIVDDKAAHEKAVAHITPRDIQQLQESRKLEAQSQQEEFQRNLVQRLERLAQKHQIPESSLTNYTTSSSTTLRSYTIPSITSGRTYKPSPFSHVPSPNPSSFALYKHLHSQGYFVSPGLRFGSQFMAYPGDPLRFHSHFLATGLEWDQDFDMIDIVGGGRLGTGVKKAWMIGATDPNTNEEQVFCVTWAGF